MPPRRVTLRSQWLGQQLRMLREEAGLKLTDAGEFIQRDGSQVSRFERGTYPVRRHDVAALLDFYGVRDKHRRETLCAFADEAWRTDWWDGYADDVQPWFIDYVWLESRATSISAFAAVSIPGLLQTSDYARAVIAASNPEAPEGAIERWVELRLKRQTVLARANAATFSTVIDESALRRAVGGPKVQAAQLRHLLDQAQASINVRVLPFTAGAHPSPEGAFSIFSLDEPYPEAVFVESPAGAIYLEPPKTGRFLNRYDQLENQAIDAKKSIRLIGSIIKDLE